MIEAGKYFLCPTMSIEDEAATNEATQEGAARDWVVDASVAIKLFVDGPLSDQAHLFFHKLVEKPQPVMYVPELFYIECTNILWKYVRFQGLSREVAISYVDALDKLALERIPTSALMADALELAMEHEISAYDACYVALAQQLRITLVTADNKLAKKMQNFGDTVQYLSEIA